MARLVDFALYLSSAAFVGYVLWRSFGGHWQVRVEADGEGLRSVRGVTRPQGRRLERFFQRDCKLNQRVVILGRRERGGMRWRVRGSVPTGVQQQIRNFLMHDIR